MLATRDELAKQFPSQKVLAGSCDVSNETQVNELVAFALRELGPLHALVLNAGIYGPMGATESVSLENGGARWTSIFTGCCSRAARSFRISKKAVAAKLSFLRGGGATNPLPNISAYAASKAAVVRLMETLAEELKPFRVDVNAIAPGALATRLVDEVLAAGPEKVGAAFYEKNKQWKEKGATPLELGARLAVYLASARERRHYRQTHQRAMGSVGKTARIQSGFEQRHLHPAPHRAERPRQELGRQMNYAIIGCGLIGKKRLAGLPAGSKLAVACDTNLARAEELAKLAQTGRAFADFKSAVADPQVDAVIVATINSALAEVAAAAIRAGKHVIVEKPAGISVKQIDELIALAEQAWGLRPRRVQSSLSSGVHQGAGNFRVRRDGRLDVHPRRDTATADASATTRNGAPTRNFPAAAN